MNSTKLEKSCIFEFVYDKIKVILKRCNMKKFLLIALGKCIIWFGKILNRGSSLPGEIILKLDSKFMGKIKLPKTVIAVTGSSGKGSVSSMIRDLYKDCGYRVAHNVKGSNLSAGIMTLLLENTTLFGVMKKDVLVFEIDERYTKYVFPELNPNYVVITNLTRDQPPRQGHFDLVFEEIKKAITNDMHLILNGDDPYLQKFSFDHKGPITYYGISKIKSSYTKNKFQNLNLNYCPMCNKKLEYEYYQFENLGNYHCSKCNFKRPKIDFEVTKLDFEKKEMLINKRYSIHIPSGILYAVYNILAAFSTTITLGLDTEVVSKIISELNQNKKLYDEYSYHNRAVYVLNNKNENSTTFNSSLLFLDRFKEKKTIVIGWKEISRRYNFDDLSWLYDIDFELLKKHDIDKIVCVGIHRYDIATRLKYAGIYEKDIMVFDSLEEATSEIKKKTSGNIYAILNFDYVEPFNHYMKEDLS